MPGKGCFVCGLPEYSAEQRQELLIAFDKSVAALVQIGVAREELIQRIRKEEEYNA